MTMGRRKKLLESPINDSPPRGHALSRRKHTFFGKSAENRKKDHFEGATIAVGKSDKRGIFGRGRKVSHQLPDQDVHLDGTPQQISYNSMVRAHHAGAHHTSTLSLESPDEMTPFETSESTPKKQSSKKLHRSRSEKHPEQEHKSLTSARKTADSSSRKTGISSKKSSGRTPNFEESLVFSELSESDVEASASHWRQDVQRSSSPSKRSSSIPRRETVKRPSHHHKQMRKVLAKDRHPNHAKHRRRSPSKHKHRDVSEPDEQPQTFIQRFLGMLDATCLAPEENDNAHLGCLGPLRKKKESARRKFSYLPEWGLAPYLDDSDEETANDNMNFSLGITSIDARDLLTIHGGSQIRTNKKKKNPKAHRRSVSRQRDAKRSPKKGGKVSGYSKRGTCDDTCDQSYSSYSSRQSSRSWDYDGTEASSMAETQAFVDGAMCGKGF